MPGARRSEFIAALEPFDLERLARDWPVFSRPAQRPAPGNWKTWMLLGGRGAGKTRSGAEWIRELVAGRARHFTGDAAGRIALVGETFQDVRSVMIEGESGLLAVHHRGERPAWIASRRRLEWPCGTVGQVFSANDPDGLRGSQFGAAWCDEIAKWGYPEETWDMLQFCMRLGSRPRQVVTTTPRPTRLIKALAGDPAVLTSRMATGENRDFLAPGFLDHVIARYGGSRLGRQEIDGEIIEDREDGLWKRGQIEMARVRNHPPLRRIVVAVDPPVTAGRNSDACGIIAAGKDAEGICYVLADATIRGVAPVRWAERAIELYRQLGADSIVAEVNQGGDMVASVFSLADPSIPVRPVRATRGKWLRAEPVALLYEQNRVRHAGSFPALEDELCAFGPDGKADGASPDRLDALVWAIHALALSSGEPRVRAI